MSRVTRVVRSYMMRDKVYGQEDFVHKIALVE